MTSPKIKGEIIFTYGEGGRLSSLLISEPIEDSQYAFLFKFMPWELSMLQAFAALTKDATFVEKQMEVTFDMFWNRYNDKERSSKKKTEAYWKKMTTADQVKAYLFIPKYERRRGTAEKKYATTYLRDELWNN